MPFLPIADTPRAVSSVHVLATRILVFSLRLVKRTDCIRTRARRSDSKAQLNGKFHNGRIPPRHGSKSGNDRETCDLFSLRPDTKSLRAKASAAGSPPHPVSPTTLNLRTAPAPVIPQRHWPKACTHHTICLDAPEFAPVRVILPAKVRVFPHPGLAAGARRWHTGSSLSEIRSGGEGMNAACAWAGEVKRKG